jgi:hypothetical protein
MVNYSGPTAESCFGARKVAGGQSSGWRRPVIFASFDQSKEDGKMD